MLEKNLKKQQAKTRRVVFDVRMGTIDHKSSVRPDRNAIKAGTRRIIKSYGY